MVYGISSDGNSFRFCRITSDGKFSPAPLSDPQLVKPEPESCGHTPQCLKVVTRLLRNRSSYPKRYTS